MPAVKWIFEIEQDYEFNIREHLPCDFTEACEFNDRRGIKRLEIHPDGRLVILAGYAWDGCTPKFALWDIVFGIPDGIPNVNTREPKAYYASLVHDVLYQFLSVHMPISRTHADTIFLELLHRDEFAPRWM